MKKDGITFSGNKQKADIPNDPFTYVFTKEDDSNPLQLPKRHIADLSPITVTENCVLKLFLGLKPHKAAGPDKVPTRLLKLCAKELAPGMTKIYQLSLDSGTLPADWKIADVSQSSTRETYLPRPTTDPYLSHQSFARSLNTSYSATS